MTAAIFLWKSTEVSHFFQILPFYRIIMHAKLGLAINQTLLAQSKEDFDTKFNMFELGIWISDTVLAWRGSEFNSRYQKKKITKNKKLNMCKK